MLYLTTYQVHVHAVYVLVQLYAFFENGLYFILTEIYTSVEARITIRMGTGHIFDTNIWYTYGIACLAWTERHIFGANIIHISSIE